MDRRTTGAPTGARGWARQRLRAASAVLAAAAVLWGPAAAAAQTGAGVQQVAGGGYHTCAISGLGRLWCWGDNTEGQLGDATRTQRTAPVRVARFGAGVRQVAAGLEHTCALNAGRRVYCWGANRFGQLGIGNTEGRIVPTLVAALGSGVQAIAAGATHTCAINRAGRAMCWGRNDLGQLGTGAQDNLSTLPVRVAGLPAGMRAIAAGGEHACVIDHQGQARCWGRGASGQLGDGLAAPVATRPVRVRGLAAGVEALALGGQFSCALDAQRAAWCWGANEAGEIGDGTTAMRPAPVRVQGLGPGLRALSAGGWHEANGHACALDARGRGFCWGNNREGQIGDRSRENRPVPVRVPRLPAGTRALGLGALHSCAVGADGRALCWGWGAFGQIGNGRVGDRDQPTAVAGDLHAN